VTTEGESKECFCHPWAFENRSMLFFIPHSRSLHLCRQTPLFTGFGREANKFIGGCEIAIDLKQRHEVGEERDEKLGKRTAPEMTRTSDLRFRNERVASSEVMRSVHLHRTVFAPGSANHSSSQAVQFS
jgi:hypothetical protein